MLPENHRVCPGPERTALIVERLKRRDTLRSIANDLGITRERVRQIALKEGVVASALGKRPMREEARKNLLRREVDRRERRELNRTLRSNYRRFLVEELRDLARVYGRAPTLKEFSVGIGVSTAGIVGAFYSRKNKFRKGTHYGRIGTARLYRLAGLTPWKPGHNPKTHPRKEAVVVESEQGAS